MSKRNLPAPLGLVTNFDAEFDRALDVASQNGRVQRWRVFSDVVTCAAISMSNAFDRGPLRDEREMEYLKIVAAYPDEVVRESLPRAFACVAMALERDPHQDFLGRAFHRLELQNKWVGQFFTPYAVCALLAEMTLGSKPEVEGHIAESGYLSIGEPACGGGAMLVAARNVLAKREVDSERVYFEAVDIDRTAALMCYIQAGLLGMCGVVRVGNSLTLEFRETWVTPALWLNPVLAARVRRGKGRPAAETPAPAPESTPPAAPAPESGPIAPGATLRVGAPSQARLWD